MISLLIPTRKRPAGIRRVVESARATAKGQFEMVFYIDNDDPESRDVVQGQIIGETGAHGIVRYLCGPRIVLSNTWNKCAEIAIGDIFGQMNDDIAFRTPGWDVMVEDAFAGCADKILMVHGSDGSNAGYASGADGFGPHGFCHRRWYETLGYFTPPFYSSDFGDTHLNELASAIGRRRHLPFVIEHLHFIFGKAEVDQTTSDRLARHSADNVEQLYRDLAPLRQLDIEKLKAAMR